MAEQQKREWVRNHKIAGYIVGRFTSDYEGEQRDLVAVQTWDGARVVPANAVISIDKEYMIEKASLDMERVLQGIFEGGLSLDDAQAAWDRAIGHIRDVAEHQNAHKK